MLKHICAPCLFVNYRLGFLCDELFFDNFYDLSFRFWLKPIVSIVLFMSKSFINVIKIFWAIKSSIPKVCLSFEMLFCVLQIWSLEFLVISCQIPITLPLKSSWNFHWFRLNKPHINITTNSLFQDFFVDDFTPPIFCYLLQNCSP